MRRKSIVVKTFLIFVLFMFLILGISWVIQTSFLERYYVYKKTEAMKRHVSHIAASMETLSEEAIQSTIADITEKNGGRLVIMNREGDILFYSRQRSYNGKRMFVRELWEKLRREGEISYRMSGNGRSVKGPMEWIVYGKWYDNGMSIIMQNPLASIRETVAITRRFYIYIFTIALCFSILLAWIFSRMVAKPLVHLNNLVKQMGNLNFDVRYKGDRQDEIGQLGETFNFLVAKLDKTIKELKVELKKEKNLDQLRKQFIAHVSHELQTPISIIQGYAEGLKDRVVTNSEDMIFYCDIIMDEADKLSGIVKDLLDLSQLESGTFRVEIRPFRFMELMEEISEKYKWIIQEKNIHFKMVGLEKEIWVLGDKKRIDQVIANFIRNAMNHTGAGGEIKFIVENNGACLKIIVQNSGQKIPEDELKFLWNSFYKAKNKEKGVGLGLAIAKSILQLHDSHFGVRNLEDGVEFFFTLKLYSKKIEND